MNERKRDFFISYNKADKDWAVWIGWVLESVGYEVVIQEWDFRPGGNFVVYMDTAANETLHTIAILSDDYLESGFTKAEWASAFSLDPTGENRRLIPIRVKKCRPVGLLGPCIYEDLVGENETDAREKVANILADRTKPSNEPVFPGDVSQSAPSGEARPFPGVGSTSMSVWHEKLDFLRSQKAVAHEPQQKAKIEEKIRETEIRIGAINANP